MKDLVLRVDHAIREVRVSRPQACLKAVLDICLGICLFYQLLVHAQLIDNLIDQISVVIFDIQSFRKHLADLGTAGAVLTSYCDNQMVHQPPPYPKSQAGATNRELIKNKQKSKKCINKSASHMTMSYARRPCLNIRT